MCVWWGGGGGGGEVLGQMSEGNESVRSGKDAFMLELAAPAVVKARDPFHQVKKRMGSALN